METKQCSKCKEVKGLSEFCKDKYNKDGLCCQCRKCRLIARNRYRSTQQGKITEKKYRLREGHKRAQQNRYVRDFHKRQACNAVNQAVRNNKLKKISLCTCTICNGQAEEYHHYNGYDIDNRLNVIPLCNKCHRILHQKIKMHGEPYILCTSL